MDENLKYIQLLFIFLINLFFLLNLKRISKKINIFDYPDKKLKLHSEQVFIGGGIIFFITFSFIYLFNIFIFNDYFMKVSTFLFASLIFFLGLVDDKFKLNYLNKFFFLIIILILLLLADKSIVVNNLRFSFSNYELNLGVYSFFFTLLCFLLFINSINLFDGINLQCGAYFLVIFSFFYFITQNYLFLFLLVPLIFFLILNFCNKVFLGDGGSLLIAFVIGYFSINLYNKNYFKSDDIIILMIVPGFDMFRLFLVRILNKRNPFKGDLNHLHHLLKNNFGLFFAVLTNIFFVLALIVLRLFFNYNSIFLLIAFVFINLLIVMTLTKFKYFRK
jgi:UDP-N-acetylmuramyl pentapeptide phosphotransferase/UDP-N-acetylglucosamine-1-phosphate transferase